MTKRAAERDHAMLQALQERLLPAGLPVLPNLRVAARYQAAGERMVAGGDWYDAIMLGDGRLGASVGDVIGHGSGAAALMGQLRSVLSAALLDSGDVVEALEQVQRFVPTVPGARGSTASVVICDETTGRVRYASAGHPPPVLVHQDGRAEFLPSPPSAPLGLPGPRPPAADVQLRPGESVLLYSDGAVQRPGVPIEQGRQRLLSACARGAAAGRRAVELVDFVLNEIGGEPPADDLALLVLSRPAAAVPPLRLRLPAEVQQLATARRELRRWLARVGISEDDSLAVQIACGEAAANAMEHAYDVTGAAEGQVTVSAELTAGSRVVVRVVDSGRWREPPKDPADRGRGLLLMRECMDEVQVRHEAEGTCVVLTRRVTGAQSLLPPLDEANPPAGCDVRLEATSDGATAVLTGELDAAGVAAAGPTLRRAARGGVLPLTIDLTGLAHLASAGVRVLFDLAGDLSSAGNRLVVRVAQGSAAHHVLHLTGFPDVARVDVVQALPAVPPRRPV